MNRPAALLVVFLAGLGRADEGHDTFVMLELKIGMPLEQAGYTCTKDPGKEAAERFCVKFTDARCTGKKTTLGTLRYGEDAPAGCYLDHSSRATYLDGKLMQTPNTGDASDKRPILKPLTHMSLTGTASRPSKIYRLWYVVPPDELTDDSKLYQALAAKYGEPTDRNPPSQAKWRVGDVSLRATCVRQRNCDLVAEDNKFGDLQRKWQEEADAKERHKNAPDAPKL